MNITRRPPQVVHQLCTRSRALSALATKLDWGEEGTGVSTIGGEVSRFTKKMHVFIIYVYICPREAVCKHAKVQVKLEEGVIR